MGTLFVVGTPIGNLEDLTARSARVLGQVDLVAAEDTRVTRRLLNHLGIKVRVTSYHQHNRLRRIPVLLEALAVGDHPGHDRRPRATNNGDFQINTAQGRPLSPEDPSDCRTVQSYMERQPPASPEAVSPPPARLDKRRTRITLMQDSPPDSPVTLECDGPD